MKQVRVDCGRRALRKFGFKAVLTASLAAATPLPLAAQTIHTPAAGAVIHATPAMWQIRAAGKKVVEEPATPGGQRRIKPFIAQPQAAVDHGRAQGMSVNHGADAVLRRVAEGVGKPVAGLETFEEQLGALARIPAAPPPASAVAAPAIAPVTLDTLLSAWKAGDMSAFSTMLSGFEAKSPIAYRMLIADRNARWGEWIVERLARPGTVFVAVGAGHLAGKDSVQQWLATKGIAATRVH